LAERTEMSGNNATAHGVRNCVLLLANAQVRLMWSKCWKIWECNMRLVFLGGAIAPQWHALQHSSIKVLHFRRENRTGDR